jgi:small subunit ribosomal protein S26e
LKKNNKKLIFIPKKRKSGGKSGSSKGHHARVQCSKCGRFVARSKAKAVTKKVSLVDGRMYSELKKSGTIIQAPVKTKYYCISCAVHGHQISQRDKSLRKS